MWSRTTFISRSRDVRPAAPRPCVRGHWPGGWPWSAVKTFAAARRSNELEIARMQGRRMYAHQRDCVPLTVNGYHRIAVAVIERSDARGQRGLNLDHVLARIKTVDGDCADRTGRLLVKHEAILTLADRY